MKKRGKLDLIGLAPTALFLFLIFSSSNTLAINEGNTFSFQENYEESIKVCDKIIEIDPQNSNAWYNKGICLVHLDNYEGALESFDKTTEINSQDSEAWYNKGICLAHLGNYSESIKASDKALEINPQYMDAWLNKGVCLAYLGNYSESIKAFDKALEISPQNFEAQYNKGLTLEDLGNYAEALESFDKVIEINPQQPGAWYKKGVCLEGLGNYAEALESFDKATEINSQDSEAWYNKGVCLAHLGNYDEAVEALDKALEINPQDVEALSLKESILSNSSDLITLSKSHFSNDNIFVEEDDLLEYAETFLKTYEFSINKSNLTKEDLQMFPFFQGYPYSVNANVSNIRGASITFIPHSIDENKAIKVSHPIEELIQKMNKSGIENISVFMTINGTNSNVSVHDNNFNGAFVYVESTNDTSIYRLSDSTPILLTNGAHFNGTTYIKSAKLFRAGKLTFNGALLLDDSKIIKSNIKNEWTKEKAEEDAIDFIYKEIIDRIFDYSKLTGIGFHEIDALVTDYKNKEMNGYYEINKYDKWSDRQKIFNKADQYKIPHASVSIALENKQEETRPEMVFRYMGDILTVRELAVIFIGIIGWSWSKRKYLRQKFIGIIGWIERKDARQK